MSCARIPILALVIICSLFPMSLPMSTDTMNSNQWYVFTVDYPTVGAGYSGYATDIALDSKDFPYISYRDETNDSLKIAHWIGSSWQFDLIDAGKDAGYSSSIKVDKNGSVHVSYLSLSERTTKYARGGNGTWTTEDVYYVYWYSWNSLDLDVDNSPHIALYDFRNESLIYAMKENGTWKHEVVDSSAEVGLFPSLAIGRDSRPRISYRDETNRVLKYAEKEGDNWTIIVVDPLPDSGRGNSLALDSIDNPHVSYSFKNASTRSRLKYATRQNDSWRNITIDWPDDVGGDSSIAIDSEDAVHIAYGDRGQGQVRYAKGTDAQWEIEVIPKEGWEADYISIALDSLGLPHVSYYDYTNQRLKYATKNPQFLKEVEASVSCHPRTLNLKSGGKWITCHIELPDEYDPYDINASSVRLVGSLAPELNPKYGFVTSEDSYIVDHDGNGIPERMLKFDRSEVKNLLAPNDEVVLTISGSLYDGARFEGSDTIRVIDPG